MSTNTTTTIITTITDLQGAGAIQRSDARMIYPDYSLVCTWGARSQTAQSIAQDLSRCAAALLEACPALMAWHYLGPKDKLTPLPHTAEGIRSEVLTPGNGARRGVGPDLTLPVGFSALLLTSKGRGASSFMAHVGAGGEWALNRVALELPRSGPLADVLTEPAMVEKLFRVLIEIWQPDWATVSHSDMSDPEPHAPVHWMLYGRCALPDGLMLPAGVEAHTLLAEQGELAAPGQYLVTTPQERFNYGTAAHRAVGEQLKHSLRACGWLPLAAPM